MLKKLQSLWKVSVVHGELSLFYSSIVLERRVCVIKSR